MLLRSGQPTGSLNFTMPRSFGPLTRRLLMDFRYLDFGKDKLICFVPGKPGAFYLGQQMMGVWTAPLAVCPRHACSKAHGESAMIPKCSGHWQLRVSNRIWMSIYLTWMIQYAELAA